MPAPPPPPPPGPPPPPMFNMGGKSAAPVKKGAVGEPDRNQLLSSIRQGAALKKTVTNDRSAPIIDGPKSSSAPATKPFTVPGGGGSGSGMNGGGAPQLGGLFAGGMPTLKATGRGRLGPANQAAPPPPGNNNKPIGGTSITRTPSTESSQWKPKTLNGSTSSSSINRGPPPQPPPANRKPTAINDTTDNSSMSRAGSAPSLPNKPPTLNFGKPNLAPKPPVPDYNKPMSPTATAPPPLPGAAGDRRSSSGSIVSMGKRPSPPPKSPVVVNAQGLNWPTSGAPAPPPPGTKPNIARAQSLRSVSKENKEVSDQDHLRNQSSMDVSSVSSPPHAPPPPPNRFATLPRNALTGGGAPRGPLPSVPRPVGSAPSFSNGSSSNISPGKGPIRPPSVRPPPPPPQRVNPPSAFPPPPPLSAPPPPPPHRMSPAPPPPGSGANSNGRTFSSPQSMGGGVPQPPTRGSSMRPSNGSVTSLTSLATAPLPPPPSALQADDFESRFASRFHPSLRLPSPEAFTNCQKLYPTRQLKRTPAPQPPSHLQQQQQTSSSLSSSRNSSSSSLRWPGNSTAAPC